MEAEVRGAMGKGWPLAAFVLVVAIAVGLFIKLNHPTSPHENEEPIVVVLTDAVGDGGEGPFDIKEIRLAEEGDNLILTMEVCENIPTWAGMDAESSYRFLIDVDNDNFYDFYVLMYVGITGLHVTLRDNHDESIKSLSFELLGPSIKTEFSLAKIGGSNTFNLRAYSEAGGPWSHIVDSAPDNGWASISLEGST